MPSIEKRSDPFAGLTKKVESLTEQEAKELLVQALYHLRCLSGSRNSFSAETIAQMYMVGIGFPQRDREVERMHHSAAQFIALHDS